MKNLLFCLMLLSSASFAGTDKTPVEGESGSSGTRGGGESVDSRLRDLVDPATCIVQKGDRFADRHAPGWRNILKKLGNVDWYFAFAIEREIKNLTICQVRSSLKRLITTDPDSFTYYQNDKTHEMVGIRDYDTVYVSSPALSRLPTYDRRYFVIHEALHAFVAMDEETRNEKVRGIVKAIESLVRGKIDVQSYIDTANFYNAQGSLYDVTCPSFKELGLKILNEDNVDNRLKYITAQTIDSFNQMQHHCLMLESDWSIFTDIPKRLNYLYVEALEKGDTKKMDQLLPLIDVRFVQEFNYNKNDSSIGLLLNQGLRKEALNLLINIEDRYRNSSRLISDLGLESVRKTVDTFPSSLKNFIAHEKTVITDDFNPPHRLEYSCGYFKPGVLSRSIIDGDYNLFKYALSKTKLSYEFNNGLGFFDTPFPDTQTHFISEHPHNLNDWSPISLAVIFNRVQMLKDILRHSQFEKEKLTKYNFAPLSKAVIATTGDSQFPKTTEKNFMRCTFSAKDNVSPYTIVDLAVRQGHFEIARLLENAGAKCRHKCKELRSHK